MSSDGTLKKIDFSPGIYKNLTKYSLEGTYVDGDKVRFRNGKAEAMAGWARQPADRNFVGVARAAHSWTDLNSKIYYAVGTNSKLELFQGGKWYDITPVESSVSVSGIFTTSAGNPLVQVSITSHNREIGDYVIFTTIASSIGGNILIGGEYVVASVASGNVFLINAGVSAAATSVSTGSGTHVDFLLGTGEVSNTFGYGWGSSYWGDSTWGTPRGGASGVPIPLRQWSLDNWGEDLLACPRGGRIYWWDATNGPAVRAVLVSASPAVNSFIKVSYPTRHLVSYGATNIAGVNDPLNIRWTDQEDFTKWGVSASSDAGEYRLTGANYIVGGADSKKEYAIYTDNTMFVQRYQGSGYVFGFDEIGKNINLCSQKAAIGVNGTTYAMTTHGFYKYDGVQTLMDSTVHDYVFKQGSEGILNFNQKEKVFAGYNSEKAEIIWLYPSGTNDENSRYVILNLTENCWYDGTLVRTTWLDSGLSDKPLATDTTGIVYAHEQGYDADGSPLKKYIESAWFDIGEGDDLMFVDKLIPDYQPEETNLNMNFTITTKKYPFSTEEFVKGPFVVKNDTSKVSLRARGRQAKVSYSTSVTAGYFKVGQPRLNIMPDGKR